MSRRGILIGKEINLAAVQNKVTLSNVYKYMQQVLFIVNTTFAQPYISLTKFISYKQY